MAIALIIFLLILLFWPVIMKWVGRFMARRAEDYLRKATGMPPRPGSRKARKEERESRRDNAAGRSAAGRRRGADRRYDPAGPIIPREYAEDVEFVETKDFSETVIGAPDNERGSNVRYTESQVSDVEWEEIKTRKKADR